VEEHDPDMMKEIQARIAEGRWEVTANAWVETDKNMPDTESLIRHIQITRDYLHKVWGIAPDAIKVDFFTFKPEAGGYTDKDRTGLIDPKTLRTIVDRVRVTRETVGPDVDIIIENHSYLDANTAIQFAQAIEPYNIMYFEEPNTPDPDTAVRLAEKINIPIASGERIYTRWQYEKYFEKNALHVAQPDIGTCGGITEVKKICDLAYIHDAAIQVHICGTPICVAAGLHVEAAIPNFVIHEHHQCNLLPDHIKLCKYDYQPVNGKYKVPELPGIGQELSDWVLTNTEYVERVTVAGKAAAWVMADVGKE
jgi:L-alanine-DL-glutamate epimerase-like enolase superfamily enzyme